jgi:hypothetical protein
VLVLEVTAAALEAAIHQLQAIRNADFDDVYPATVETVSAYLALRLSIMQGREAAYAMIEAFDRQEAQLEKLLRRLGLVDVTGEPSEAVERLPVPAPLIAQRFERVSRELGHVTLDGTD